MRPAPLLVLLLVLLLGACATTTASGRRASDTTTRLAAARLAMAELTARLPDQAAGFTRRPPDRPAAPGQANYRTPDGIDASVRLFDQRNPLPDGVDSAAARGLLEAGTRSMLVGIAALLKVSTIERGVDQLYPAAGGAPALRCTALRAATDSRRYGGQLCVTASGGRLVQVAALGPAGASPERTVALTRAIALAVAAVDDAVPA